MIIDGLLGLALLVWLWWNLVWRPRWPRRTRLVLSVILTITLLGSALATLASRYLGLTCWRLLLSTGSALLIFYLYLGLALLPVALIWALTSRRQWGKRLTIIATVVAMLAAGAITAWGADRAARLPVDQLQVTQPRLPANFDGMTIALVTDVHLGATSRPTLITETIDQLNEAHPDLIVFGGDLIDGSVANLGDSLRPLTELSAPDGVVFTTGNHEMYHDPQAWIDFEASIGLTQLNNDGFKIWRGKQSIELIGIDDASGQGQLAPSLRWACRQANDGPCSATDGVFRILVAHQPRQALANHQLPPQLGIDLQLSGHTHGGQFLPFGLTTLLVQPMLSGVAQVGGITVVTSRGVAGWGPQVRVGADPQIVLITLRR
ncbi:MAG: metallophosphoesterase [Propionibacteriaceae bacterium]|nr:metallophosphoesterase [Propionibacteriaceae bacterium]